MINRLKEHRTRLRNMLAALGAIQGDHRAAAARVDEKNADTGHYKFSEAERHAEHRRLTGLAMTKMEPLGLPDAWSATRKLRDEAATFYSSDAILSRARFVPPAAGASTTDTLLTELLERFSRSEARDEYSRLTDAELALLVSAAAERGDLATLHVLNQTHQRNVQTGANNLDTSMALIQAKAALAQLPELVEADALDTEIDSLAVQLQEKRDAVAVGKPEQQAKLDAWRAAAA
ncbi:MAG: hypothetical protein ACRERC_16175 [Candidatus Binatia bacterium]